MWEQRCKRTINSSKRRHLERLWSSSNLEQLAERHVLSQRRKTSTMWRKYASNRTVTISWLPEIGGR